MIGVIYTCDPCGIKDAVVQVRERGATETVVEWMGAVQLALGLYHAARSPQCGATEATYAKIPISPSPDARIGDPTAH